MRSGDFRLDAGSPMGLSPISLGLCGSGPCKVA